MPSRRREVQDAAQEEEEAREKKKPTLVNVSGRGLCCVRKNGKLDSAGDVSMVPIGKARDQALNLKGFVWHLKFYPSTDKVPVYVDKTQNKSPDLFEKAVDSQTEFDCNFRIKGGPMWSNFINESISRAGNEVGLATYDFVKQIGPDKSQKSRDGEIWVLGPGNYMDHKGNSTTAKKIWLSPNLCKKAQDLPAVIWKTGDTEEIMASVFEVLTPFNEVPCLMGIAGGLQAMHGSVIRLETDGQLGMLMFRSKDTGTGSGGKGQGKSGAAKLLMWLTSCLENHKLDPEVSKEEFKKFANSTGLLICIEDIKNFKKLSQILAWQYDDNMTYRNKEVDQAVSMDR